MNIVSYFILFIIMLLHMNVNETIKKKKVKWNHRILALIRCHTWNELYMLNISHFISRQFKKHLKYTVSLKICTLYSQSLLSYMNIQTVLYVQKCPALQNNNIQAPWMCTLPINADLCERFVALHSTPWFFLAVLHCF